MILTYKLERSASRSYSNANATFQGGSNWFIRCRFFNKSKYMKVYNIWVEIKTKTYPKTLYLPFCRTGMVARAVLLPWACVCVAVTVYVLLQMCVPVPGQPASKVGHQADTSLVVYQLVFSSKQKKLCEMFEKSHSQKRKCQLLISNVDKSPRGLSTRRCNGSLIFLLPLSPFLSI